MAGVGGVEGKRIFPRLQPFGKSYYVFLVCYILKMALCIVQEGVIVTKF